MRMRTLLLVGAGAVVVLGTVRWQLARLFTDEPAYDVEQRIGDVEVRRYAASLRAETTVEARSSSEALSAGFRRLAGYIFGGNAPRERIAMTAPVTQESERIAMTVPVTQSQAEGAQAEGAQAEGARVEGANADERFTVTFTMPKGRTLASMPVPDDARVILREVPARRVAVLRYRGRYAPEGLAEKAHELEAVLTRAGIEHHGRAEWAGYDPPTTLPLLRRNEVWIDLEPRAASPAAG